LWTLKKSYKLQDIKNSKVKSLISGLKPWWKFFIISRWKVHFSVFFNWYLINSDMKVALFVINNPRTLLLINNMFYHHNVEIANRYYACNSSPIWQKIYIPSRFVVTIFAIIANNFMVKPSPMHFPCVNCFHFSVFFPMLYRMLKHDGFLSVLQRV